MHLRLVSWIAPPLLLVFFPYLLPIHTYILSTPAQAQTSQNRKAEADKLFQQGIQQFNTSQFEAALQSWQQALKLYQQIKDRQSEGAALGNLGLAYSSLGNYAKAIEYQQQDLAIAREIKDRQSEGAALGNLGLAYFSLGNYAKAIEYGQQDLAIAREIKDRQGEGQALGNLGIAYSNLGNYAKAIEYGQQDLAIAREIKDRQSEGIALGNLGLAYSNLGNYAKAIEYQQQWLAIAREIKDRQSEGIALGNLGLAYSSLGNYAKAIEYQQQWLAIAREIKDRQSEGAALGNLGINYSNLGNYAKAIEYAEQYLAITREIKDRQSEGGALGNLGIDYSNLGNYAKAIEYAEQHLAIAREIKDRQGEGKALGNLGNAYYNLGNYAKAIEYAEQVLAIAREIKDRQSEGKVLGNLGLAYYGLENYAQAIEYAEQWLAIAREIKDHQSEGKALGNLGLAYLYLGNYAKAIEYAEQYLAITQEIKDRQGEGKALGNLGLAYLYLGNYAKAIEYAEQYLAITREIKDRESEGEALNNIALSLEKQEEPELAIVFYKQSVNVRESIRNDIRTLPREQQESYTQTVADTYRRLADLLLSQGRLLEAQQVLELLKIQELRDFTRNARAGGETSGIALARIEEEILNKYGTLIVFGQQVYECEQKKCNTLSQLRDQLDVLTQKFQQDANAFRKTLQDRLAKDPALLEPEQLRSTAAKIVTTQPGTILIYPLVLKDKIRILLASRAGEKGVVFRSFETPVDQQQLWKTVNQFRTQLSNRDDETAIKTTSQQLYKWLIQPLEKEIKNSNVHHLVFSLDRSTRYIPMAALFDGQKYLIERYAVSTVLNAGLTDAKDRLPKNKQEVRVLAMGVSKAFPGFNALSYVPDELATIIQQSGKAQQGIFPGSEFLNENFTFNSLRDNLTGNKVLHLATHAKFESGRPENSYLLSGSGDKLTVDKIQTLGNYMADTHLVVLSACETALGGVDADGLEMSGMSFYFLTNGAKSVIASLWLVNDASTSQLMQRFYQNLSTGQMTKTEALRQAQLAMLKSNSQGNNSNRSSVNYKLGQGEQSISRNLNHPYYWAPFILIGNGW
ncbi:CHAT domain-containing protein [Calothrix parietina]|uniref:CHAT domain-containing protein n=1 Tax=Calothrix parietina TaxID=32054 RepID=UPI001F5500EB|nr:tetratricopeptide repeat protein [Calothrix parietina]